MGFIAASLIACGSPVSCMYLGVSIFQFRTASACFWRLRCAELLFLPVFSGTTPIVSASEVVAHFSNQLACNSFFSPCILGMKLDTCWFQNVDPVPQLLTFSLHDFSDTRSMAFALEVLTPSSWHATHSLQREFWKQFRTVWSLIPCGYHFSLPASALTLGR